MRTPCDVRDSVAAEERALNQIRVWLRATKHQGKRDLRTEARNLQREVDAFHHCRIAGLTNVTKEPVLVAA